MATTTSASATSLNPLGLDLGSYGDPVQRMQDLTARVVEGTKATSLTSLDAVDRVVQTLTDLQIRLVDSAAVGWYADQNRIQAQLVRDVTAAYTKAGRAALA